MPHEFQRNVASYASGMLTMMISRVEEHQQQFGGRYPQMFVLHPDSLRAQRTESYQRFGVIEKGPDGAPCFMGVPIFVCMCGKPMAEDAVVDCTGRTEPL